MDPVKAMEDAEAYERRLEEIDELLPLKYRYPKTYRPRLYDYRSGSVPPSPVRASSLPPLRASSVPPLAPLRAMTPLRTYTPPPRHPSEKVGYSYAGLPIYSRGALGRRALSELLEPSPWLPKSRITGDPWWWDYPSLRPYYSPLYYGRSPYYLRSSYLSPIKRTYLWGLHPLRPFSDPWWLDYALRSACRSRYYGTTPKVLHSSYTTPVKSHVLNTEPFSDSWWWDYPSMKSHFATLNRLKNPVKRTYVWTVNPRWEYNSIRYWV